MAKSTKNFRDLMRFNLDREFKDADQHLSALKSIKNNPS
jgi:hypothetical protein